MVRKITWQEKLSMKLLRNTHWFCVMCGDFHRWDCNIKCQTKKESKE